MLSIDKRKLPDEALLARYDQHGTYTDCYTTDLDGLVTHSEFVVSFYTTILFRIERLILKWAVSRPSTDEDAERLANGETDKFAAWYVEDRAENQLLMCDFRDRTRSWLMVSQLSSDEGVRTRLYFGSAVVPVRDPESNEVSLGRSFHLLAGFHKLYSVALLRSAKSKLLRKNRS